jgi:hypothetical protein
MKPFASFVVTFVLGMPAAAWSAELDFVDVAPQHQAATAVQHVVKAGLVSGFDDHTFRGWKPVSRYELITSAARLLPTTSLKAPAGPVLVAPDVAASHWAFPALARMTDVGIGQQLWAGGKLDGDRPATRFDLAYLATQTCSAWSLAATQSTDPGTFTDIPAGHWAAPAVRQAAELGLMGGLAQDQFGGDKQIDRYQLAIVLDRLLAKVQSAQAPMPQANVVAGAAPTSQPANAVPPLTSNLVTVQEDGSMSPVPPLTTITPVNQPAAASASPQADPSAATAPKAVQPTVAPTVKPHAAVQPAVVPRVKPRPFRVVAVPAIMSHPAPHVATTAKTHPKAKNATAKTAKPKTIKAKTAKPKTAKAKRSVRH